MSIVTGPFDIEVGGVILGGIETLDVSYDVKSDSYDSIQGNTYTVPGAHAASVEATFLENDVASLAAAVPQYLVANGGTLSTGETVTASEGVIDIVPSVTGTPRDLILVSSNAPLGQVMRLKNTLSQISGVDVSATVRKVKVKFIVQPTQNQALMQFLKETAIAGIS